MIAALMAYAFAVAAVVWVAAAAIDHAASLVRRPRRYVWLAGLGFSAALAALPLIPTAVDSPSVARGGPGAPQGVTPGSAASEVAASAVAAPSLILEARQRVTDLPRALARFDRPLLFTWAATSIAWAAVLIASAFRLRRRRRGWSPDVVDGVPVHVSHDVGPALVGLTRYTIVIPAWMRMLAVDHRRLILEHEMEHARAADPLTLAVGALLVLLQPWNPLTWTLFRRLRLAVEADCDARVLARMPDVRAYGELLIDVGERTLAGVAPVAALSEPHSQLARRISLMTPRTYGRPLIRSSAAGLTGALLVVGACQLPRPIMTGASAPAGSLPADMDLLQYRWVEEGTGADAPARYSDPATGAALVLSDSVALDMGGIVRASVTAMGGGSESSAAVVVSLTPGGAARFGASTATHVGRRLAVVVDGRVIQTAVVQSALGASVPLVTDVSRELADSLATRVNRVARLLGKLGGPVEFRRDAESTPGAAKAAASDAAPHLGQRTLVRLTSVGLDGVAAQPVVYVATTGEAMVGLADDAPRRLTDTLRLQSFPSMTLDVTDGDVVLWTTGNARLRLEGVVTNGPARRIGGEGRRLIVFRGGTGIRGAD